MADHDDAATNSPALAPEREPPSMSRSSSQVSINRSSSSLSGLARRGAERMGEDLGDNFVLLGELSLHSL
jgi:hypothetical protein